MKESLRFLCSRGFLGAWLCEGMKMKWKELQQSIANYLDGSQVQNSCKVFSQRNLCYNSTLPLVISIHNINLWDRCIGWLYNRLSCDRCNLSSINKISARVVAILKKLFVRGFVTDLRYCGEWRPRKLRLMDHQQPSSFKLAETKNLLLEPLFR